MQLHLRSHQWEARVPDWIAAAIAGFVAGAVVMVMELLWSIVVLDISPWAAPHLVAAIVMGPSALESTAFSVSVVTVALLTHYVLGAIVGVILASIIAPFHFDSSILMIASIGAMFGLVLYIFNFYGMVHIFPWFAGMRNGVTLTSHLLFGITAAIMYRQLERY